MMYSNAKFVEQEAQQQQVKKKRTPTLVIIVKNALRIGQWDNLMINQRKRKVEKKSFHTTYQPCANFLGSVRWKNIVDLNAGAGPTVGRSDAHGTKYARDCKYDERRAAGPVHAPG